MVAALKERGVPVGYLLFDGEQHGFRKAENIKRALDAELYFYAMLILRSGLRVLMFTLDLTCLKPVFADGRPLSKY